MEKMGFTIKINVWAVALRCTRFHTNLIHTEIRRHLRRHIQLEQKFMESYAVLKYSSFTSSSFHLIPFGCHMPINCISVDVGFISIHSVVSLQRSHNAKTKQGILFKQGESVFASVSFSLGAK